MIYKHSCITNIGEAKQPADMEQESMAISRAVGAKYEVYLYIFIIGLFVLFYMLKYVIVY